MHVFILSKNVPVDSIVVLACSQSESAIKTFRDQHGDVRDQISPMELPFEIVGQKEIFAANCDIDNFGIYVDIGQYFKTQDEARSFVAESNAPYKSEKFKVEGIKIV